MPIGGMMMSSTNEVTILPNAAPITIPTAKSITFPLEINSLKSDVNDIMFEFCGILFLLDKKDKFILKVIDNGKGFDGTIKGSGNGWKNMHKRTDYLNGKLTIDSEPGKGTKIIVSIPYPFKIPSSWDLKEQDH